MARKLTVAGPTEEYNAGSANIEELFKELVKLSRELSEEEKRAVAEGLSEEELVCSTS